MTDIQMPLPTARDGARRQTEMFNIIQEKFSSFSKSHQSIALYILNHPREVIYLSITELAEKAGVGEATVSRFCRILKLKGFQELKLALAQDNAVLTEIQKSNYDDSSVDGLSSLVASRITQVVQSTIQSLDEAAVKQACQLLAAARKIDFYGVGSSGVLALDASQMFLGLGKQTTAYPDPHIQVMSATLLTSKDVAVAFSHSGSTKDTVTALRKARESGAFTISITSYARSPITRVSDLVLVASFGDKEVFTSSYSMIGEMVLLERLYAGCMLELGDQAQEARQKITSAIMDKMY